jgi:SAM-dependent methyltransferase
MDNAQLPEEFDVQLYRESYTDLSGLSDRKLRAHWRTYGRGEGRVASKAAYRENFLTLVEKANSILEIGPFSRPAVEGPNVKYFDLFNSEELSARAHAVGYTIKAMPKIDFVSPMGDLSIVDERFSAIVSSHCIEHQPDLIRHLQNVSAILDEDGSYFVIIPDKRYCFDHFIEPSKITQVLDAFKERRTTHSLAAVINQIAITTHNDSMRHWRGAHSDPGYLDSISVRSAAAEKRYAEANGEYIDVHAWQFTPTNFRFIIQRLFDMGLTDLNPERVYETPCPRDEFTAVLKKRPARKKLGRLNRMFQSLLEKRSRTSWT